MILRLKPLFAGLIVAAVIGLAVFGIDRYRHRFVRSHADMVALLPQGDWTLFFADFGLLRRAGILQALSGSKASEDAEYRQFVQDTGFDYTRDVESLAGASDGSQVFFIVRGRFDWSRLRRYATTHGGACHGDFCNVPTTRPGRWASFLPVQGNVIGLAVSADKTAAYQLSPRRDRTVPPIPAQPVWVKVAHRVLEHPEGLPVVVRLFAISLAPADSVLLSLGPSGNAEAPYSLELDAECATKARASVVIGQMQTETKMLQAELAREHQPISRSDLTGLLASGAFLQKDNRVVGKWPVYRQLLASLQ